MENDEIIDFLQAIKNKKHKRISNYTNDSLILLWESEIYKVVKEFNKKRVE